MDIAEGVRDGSSVPHLLSCTACRRLLADLQGTMSEVGGLGIPEPSPLFWDHLSARVAAAVETERATASGIGRWSRWSRWSLSSRSSLSSLSSARPIWAGTLALAVFAIALMRMAWTPGTAQPVAPLPAATVQAQMDDLGALDDPSLSLVADLVADLNWEEAREAGLTTHVGADNDAVTQLTDAERHELHELLTGEMKRPGA